MNLLFFMRILAARVTDIKLLTQFDNTRGVVYIYSNTCSFGPRSLTVGGGVSDTDDGPVTNLSKYNRHTRTHTHTHARTHAFTHAHTHAHTHTHTHKQTVHTNSTHAHTHAHTHTHTHTVIRAMVRMLIKCCMQTYTFAVASSVCFSFHVCYAMGETGVCVCVQACMCGHNEMEMAFSSPLPHR